MPKPASTRPAYKMLTCIYLCRTLLFFAPYADFFKLNPLIPRSQTFLIEDNKILCGSPLDNKMIMNIFIDYIKN